MWKCNKKGKLKGYIDYNEIPYVIKVKKIKNHLKQFRIIEYK